MASAYMHDTEQYELMISLTPKLSPCTQRESSGTKLHSGRDDLLLWRGWWLVNGSDVDSLGSPGLWWKSLSLYASLSVSHVEERERVEEVQVVNHKQCCFLLTLSECSLRYLRVVSKWTTLNLMMSSFFAERCRPANIQWLMWMSYTSHVMIMWQSCDQAHLTSDL